MADAPHYYAVFETELGFAGIGWTDAGVNRFQLPASSAASTEHLMRKRDPSTQPATPPAAVAEAIAAIKRYFAGEAVDFSAVPLDLGGQDHLSKRIYDAARRVGWGQTTTYGTLAKELGTGPEDARDVGQAMAHNPVGLIIPCHRVLAAGGKLGGFSAPGGANTKLRMLALEGVDLSPPAAQGSFGF